MVLVYVLFPNESPKTSNQGTQSKHYVRALMCLQYLEHMMYSVVPRHILVVPRHILNDSMQTKALKLGLLMLGQMTLKIS